MRRHEKQITDVSAIEDILRRALVCRLALCDEGRPYIVPLCFGYKDNALYFHSANAGKKLDILRKNNNVCFEVDIDNEPVKIGQACNWGMKYKSVIGFGKAVFIETAELKREALDVIMGHYSNGDFKYSEEAIKNIEVIKVEIESMIGKQSG
jgi:uncharacterized protein